MPIIESNDPYGTQKVALLVHAIRVHCESESLDVGVDSICMKEEISVSAKSWTICIVLA